MKVRAALFGMLLLLCGGELRAQYWVEFEPGTCQVGPPPICVTGHWYWVEAPQVSSTAAKPAEGQSRLEDIQKPSEISTDLEYETFSRSTLDGSSIGLRALYERTLSSGIVLGGRLTYDRASFDGSDLSAKIFSGSLYVRRSFAEEMRNLISLSEAADVFVSGGLSYTRYRSEPFDPLTSWGPFLNVGFMWYQSSFNIGGGFSYTLSQVKYEPFIDESKSTISLGINSGYTFSEKMSGALELFRLKDGIYVTGVSAGYHVSDTFGLMLGIKKLFGIEEFSNFKITLGSSVRF
jgi:hypothetical protein